MKLFPLGCLPRSMIKRKSPPPQFMHDFLSIADSQALRVTNELSRPEADTELMWLSPGGFACILWVRSIWKNGDKLRAYSPPKGQTPFRIGSNSGSRSITNCFLGLQAHFWLLYAVSRARRT